MNSQQRDLLATETTQLATGAPPIRSRVAPDINPMGGGVVEDSQGAGTSPGDGGSTGLSGAEIAVARAYAEGKGGEEEPHKATFKDKVEGVANVVVGKVFDNPAKVVYGKAKAQGEV